MKIKIILIASALCMSALIAYRQIAKTAPEQQYLVQAVEQGSLRQTVSANGTINPVTLVSVGTQVSGTVKSLYVDYNSKVEKGQILLELDDALLTAQLRQDEANVQSAAASLELALQNEARTRNLFDQEYASRLDLDTAVQAKKSAQAQLKLTRATVEKDRANLSYTVIRSPVSGVVIDRSVDKGQTVAASLQTPTLFKIAQDLSKMQIDANFAEADIGSIRVGQTVRFTVDAFPGKNFQGAVRLVRLNPTNQQNVITYDVIIDVDNPDQILMPGMTAYVSISVAERKDALLVPNAALRFKPREKIASKSQDAQGSPDGGKVYILRQGKPSAVALKLGITDSRSTEIVSGNLKAGDNVITGEAGVQNASTVSQPLRMRMF